MRILVLSVTHLFAAVQQSPALHHFEAESAKVQHFAFGDVSRRRNRR